MRVTGLRKLFLAIVLTMLEAGAQQSVGQAPVNATHQASVHRSYGALPLAFEVNKGQSDSQVKYLSRGAGYSVFLTSGGMVLALSPLEEVPVQDYSSSSNPPGSAPRTAQALAARRHGRDRALKSARATVSINLVGSASNPVIVGEQPLATKVN